MGFLKCHLVVCNSGSNSDGSRFIFFRAQVFKNACEHLTFSTTFFLKLLCDWRSVLSNSPRPSQTILAPVPATAATGNTGRAFGESFLIEVPTSARTWNGAECSISTLIRTALQSLLRTDKVFQSPTSTAQEKTNRPTAQRPACCWAAEQAWLSWELPVQQRKSLASLSALVFFTAEHTLDRRVQTTFFDSDWKNKKKVTLQSYWLQNNQSLFVFLQSLLFFFGLSHQLNNRQMHFHHKTNAIAAPCRCCECLCTFNNWQKIKQFCINVVSQVRI